MTRKHQGYLEYKNSGVEWLGDIPVSWVALPVKRISEIFNGATPKSGEPTYWNGDISWVTPADLGKTDSPYICDGARSITASGYDSCGTSLVPEKTIVLASRAPIGTLGIATKELCTNQGCKSLVVEIQHSYKYLYYFLLSSTEQLNLLGRGTTFLELSSDSLGSYKVSLPCKSEQKVISNFLDYETARIDSLIEKQQQLIKLLKEKRQAVISHAVTKGLDPNAPMRDSGIEWLGDVPEHWEVKKFKFLCDRIIAGPFGSSITKDMYIKLGFKVYGQEQVIPNDFEIGDYYISEKDYLELSRYIVNEGDILISCVGTFGKIAVFPVGAEQGIINPRLIKAKTNNECNPYFVRELLKSEMVFKQFELLSRGGTMGVINIAILSEILAVAPPKEEQGDIVEYINEQKEKFSNLMECANRAVSLLQERRTALISAAVTGKIDVRNWQAPIGSSLCGNDMIAGSAG